MNKQSDYSYVLSAPVWFITLDGRERRNQAIKTRQTDNELRYGLRSRQNIPVGRVGKGTESRSDEWETGDTYEFPTVRFPSRDMGPVGHRQMDHHSPSHCSSPVVPQSSEAPSRSRNQKGAGNDLSRVAYRTSWKVRNQIA